MAAPSGHPLQKEQQRPASSLDSIGDKSVLVCCSRPRSQSHNEADFLPTFPAALPSPAVVPLWNLTKQNNFHWLVP